MSPQIYVLLIFSTTTNVLIAQIVDYGFGRRPELMPNGIKYNMFFPNSVPRYNPGHGTTGTNKMDVPFVWYQVPQDNVNKRYLNNFLGKWPNKVHKQHFPSNADILRGMYSGFSVANRRQGYVDYSIPYIPLIYNVPGTPSTIPKIHSNNFPPARIVPDSVKIDNQFGSNEMKNRKPIESSILRRPESTFLSDSDKKTDVIYNNNNRQFDFVQHAIEKILLPKKPIIVEKKIKENDINIHLKQHKPYEEVISSTEDIIMTSVDFTYVTPKSVTPETDVSIYIVDGVPFNKRKMVSEQTEKEEMTTHIVTKNIVGLKSCCLLSNEKNTSLNNIPGHGVAKDKLLKVISTTKEDVGSNVSLTPNNTILRFRSAINVTTEPIIINGKLTTPIKKITETIKSIEQTEKRESTMEDTATEAYTEIVPKHEIGLDKMDESVTNTIEDSSVMTTPTLNQHTTDETIESKTTQIDRTRNVEPYKKTVKETIPDLVTSWTKQDLEESIKTETNTIEENVAHNFSTTDHASSTPHSNYSNPLGASDGNTWKTNVYTEGEIYPTDDGEKSSQSSKTHAQTFVNSVEQLERRFHETNFNILATLAPADRRENAISFLQSGFLLLVSLTALSTTVDEPTREEIANITLYAGTDEEKANTIRSVLEGLPKTNSNLTIRWSNRLVLAPGYNLSEAFWRDSAENMKIHVDFLNDTSDPAVLTKTLNHLVEIDSGGAMRDDTFYEDELTSNVRCVLLSTLYIRARWRVGPTLLNGTRRFFDTTEDVRTTPMVRINDVVRYASVERWDADAVEISYATAGLTLLILVPRGRSVRALTGHVAEEGLRNVLNSMATRRVAVTLPVYTLRMSLLLPNKLQSMGVTRLMEGKDQQMRLSHAIQRIMYWSEAGRNAYKDDGLEWDEIPEMELVVDRPYLFFVRWHNVTLLNGNFVL